MEQYIDSKGGDRRAARKYIRKSRGPGETTPNPDVVGASIPTIMRILAAAFLCATAGIDREGEHVPGKHEVPGKRVGLCQDGRV
ncbi:hypothetical protein E2C01_057367 [Portunus trituberculatus]|uniref:Uncharacterized protein n=1 Tax=Portunus trituberculatus TaxID=210409 RepID=A0A5B7GSQ1_PORTR|nr:hypothetical protein [Portunus trituberculatus]